METNNTNTQAQPPQDPNALSRRRIGVFWDKSFDGKTKLTGKMNLVGKDGGIQSVRVLIISNNRKTAENQPDFELFVLQEDAPAFLNGLSLDEYNNLTRQAKSQNLSVKPLAATPVQTDATAASGAKKKRANNVTENRPEFAGSDEQML